MAPESQPIADPDSAGTMRHFGFGWFVPELLKHKRVWRDVLLASLALQMIALATPLFTQAIIDKVVVHRTQSTLTAIAVAMALVRSHSLPFELSSLSMRSAKLVQGTNSNFILMPLLAVKSFESSTSAFAGSQAVQHT